MEHKKKYSEVVKTARQRKGLTQDELAKKVGYKSRSSINKIELGESPIPQKKLDQFSKILDVPVEMLVDDNFSYSIEDKEFEDDLNRRIIFNKMLAYFGYEVVPKSDYIYDTDGRIVDGKTDYEFHSKGNIITFSDEEYNRIYQRAKQEIDKLIKEESIKKFQNM